MGRESNRCAQGKETDSSCTRHLNLFVFEAKQLSKGEWGQRRKERKMENGEEEEGFGKGTP